MLVLNHSHRIHGIGIFTYMYYKFQPNVGKSTVRPMDPSWDLQVFGSLEGKNFRVLLLQDGVAAGGSINRFPYVSIFGVGDFLLIELVHVGNGNTTWRIIQFL